MKVRAISLPSGDVVVISPAYTDRGRPRRPVRDAEGNVVFDTVQRTRKEYDFVTKQVVDVTFETQVPRMEYEHSDDEWAERCIALTLAKNPRWAGLPFVDLDHTQLPTRTQRSAWRIQNGRVIAATGGPA